MCEEKRTDDRPAEGGALNSGGPTPVPWEKIYLQRINDFQHQSPLLGNIYPHFVQGLWIKKVVARKSTGSALFRRYADDSVVCFARKDDAEAYLRDLPAH
jgi:hypothetical protein